MANGCEARFELGQLLITPGAAEALKQIGTEPIEFICRHACGDWGELCVEDVAENELALQDGLKLLSAYRLADGQKLWIITEADRSCTTLLLPEEY